MIKTYRYKLYKTKKLKHLDKLINLSGGIYNHCIALHKRYYKLYGKTLNIYKLQKHITKLKNCHRYNHWYNLGSQAIQEITERIDNGYQKFFNHENSRPPTFKKIKKYKSFTLKGTVGYKLKDNSIIIDNKHYRLWLSREIPEDAVIKTVNIKRNTAGDFFISISLETEIKSKIYTMTGKIAGIDFGLKTFLVLSDINHKLTDEERERKSPQYLLKSIKELKKLNRQLSRKAKGSNHRKHARLKLAKLHIRIANQREDYFHKLSNELASIYDYIFVEDLNIDAMKRLWGRKVSDIAYIKFINILSYKTKVHKIDKWFPSSKLCFDCGYVKTNLNLKDRIWICPKCGVVHNRDYNASDNILGEGASSLGLEGYKTCSQAAFV